MDLITALGLCRQSLFKACRITYSMYADMKTIFPGDMIFVHTGGIRLETKIEEMAINLSFTLDQKIIKPIKGIQNTMKDEYILFLRKSKNLQGGVKC